MATTYTVLSGQSIQDAINAAAAGDTIIVKAGTYSGNILIDKSITLISESGAGATTIIGDASGGALGTILIASGVNNVVIGGIGHGFTVEGIDNASPAIESAAIYLQGAHSYLTIQGNNIVANGDEALLSEYGASITHATIDSNTFSGSTFDSGEPIPDFTTFGADQFNLPNIPRVPVYFGGAGKTDIHFTNNTVSTVAGGADVSGDFRGNTLVVIDGTNNVATGNTFNGVNQGANDVDHAPALRMNGTGAVATGNTFDEAHSGGFTSNDAGAVIQNSYVYGSGDDHIYAAAGNDHIDGGAGNDTYDMQSPYISYYAPSQVNLTSGIASSSITGIDTLTGIENVKGAYADDILIGNSGDNIFYATNGHDTIDGRGGNDTFDASDAASPVVIDLDAGYVGGYFNATLTSVENATGGSGADYLVGSMSANVLSGNGGNDTFLNLHDGDVVHGGSGLDSARFDGNRADADITETDGVYTVKINGETVTLDSVGVLHFDDGDIRLVGKDAGTDYSTIQSAIDASHTGDVILVADGSYDEHVNVNVAGITIKALGTAAVIQGSLEADNGITGSVAEFLQTHAYSSAAGTGIQISANNVTLEGLNIDGFKYGIEFAHDATIDGTSINGVHITDSVIGVEKGATAAVTNLAFTGGSISDGHIGFDLVKNTTPGQSGVGNADHVIIDGTNFSDLMTKGIYAETLSNAHITNVTMDNVGQYGFGSALGTPGTSGNGINLNLKNGTYSNVEIDNFHLTNVGASDQNGQAAIGNNSGAIVIEARNDGTTYGGAPAIFAGSVNVHDGTIDGHTSTGIQVGEPSKGNADPLVKVSDVSISGAQHDALHGDIGNETHSVMTYNGSAAVEVVSTSGSSTGQIDFHGGAGDDSFVGHNELNVAKYDVELSASNITYDAVNHQWVVDAGADGIDRLSGVEQITDSAGHTFVLAGNGYGTLQAAIDAAAVGGTILVADTVADTDNVNVDKQVTILGIQHGAAAADGDGNLRTGAESVFTHGLYITADGVTIDGLEVTGAVQAGGTERAYGIVVGADNVTIKNSILDGATLDQTDTGPRPFGTVAGVENVSVTGNAIHDWAQGAYLTNGTTGSIDHNVFAHNGNGVVTESVDTVIAHNTFSDSAGAHVAANPYVDANIGNYVHDNMFLDQDRPISSYLNGGDGQEVTGTDNGETFHLEYHAGAAIVHGGGGDDHFGGGTGNDTIDGGTGNDVIDGDAGTDTAVYTAPISTDNITYDAGTQTWTVTTGTEGTDTLRNVEVIDGGGSHILLVGGGGYATIQAAVDAAHDGDTILVASGVHAEDVTIADKALTIEGLDHGTPGLGHTAADGSVILGRVSVSGSKAVVFDGLEFRADSTTGTTGHANGALQLYGTGDITVQNSLFYSDFAGGSVEATAIQIDTTFTGAAHIESNLFTGSHMSNYGGASWQRGIWSDGSSSDLDIHGNSFSYVRSAINLDGYDDTTHEVWGNTFISAGSGISVGLPKGATFAGIHDNDFQTVGDDFNFQNVATPVELDLTASHEISSAGDGLLLVDGGQAGDHITGAAGSDVIFALGGNDVIIESAGNDYVDGGADIDTYVLNGDWKDYTITRSGGTYTITHGIETDTVTNVENFSFNGHSVDVSAHPDAIVTDFAPVIQSIVDADDHSSVISVAENSAIGTAVATVTVTDGNLAGLDQLTYALVDGSGQLYTGPFAISGSGNTATVTVNGPINYEASNSFAIQVKVTDATGHSVTQPVPVFVTNVNEAPTSISLDNTTVDDDTVGAIVGTLTGTDPDAGDHLTFSVTDARFEVVTLSGNQTLKLKDGAQLDYQDGSVVTLAVTATDSDGLQHVQNFDLQVNDINTLPPPGPLGTQDVSVKETAVAAALNIAVPVDPDGDTLTFTANVLPTLGAVLLNGHALTVGQTLTAADVAALTYTAPITQTGTGGLQLSYTDGHNPSQSLSVNITVTPSGTDIPKHAVYDFNGDHNADLFFTNSTTNGAAVWTLDGSHVTANPQVGIVPAGSHYADQGDFNGDGKTDLLLIDDATHQVNVWQMNGTTMAGSGSPGTINAAGGWGYAATADFNGDGKSDLLFINSANNGVAVWQMDGTSATGKPQVGTMADGFHFAGLGDFNGDGKTDVLTVNDTTHQVDVRLMDGTHSTTEVNVGSIDDGYQLVQSGDFNGDSNDDLLFFNESTNHFQIWQMNGTDAPVKADVDVAMNAAGGWHFQDVGDFNGDGQSDLLFLNDGTGGVAVWTMDGNHVTASPQVGLMGADQHFDHVADTNGDGKDDLVFLSGNASHDVTVWQMNGTQVADDHVIGHLNAAGGWHLIG